MYKWLEEWIVKKSIPVIRRLSNSQFLLEGTSRMTSLSSIIGGHTVNEPYREHAWVHGAVESVALNISQTPLTWKNSRDKKAAERQSNKWLTLFEKPNQDMGLQQLMEATVTYLLLNGECMWVLDRAEPTALPTEIMPFDGRLFEPILNKAQKVVGWKTESIGEDGQKTTVPFKRWEVCHFKLFNPYDPIRGLSPIEAAQLGIDQDSLASQYNKAFFSNSALPGGVIEIEDSLTEEQFNRMLAQFREHHQGVNKAHTLALLEGGATYKQLAISQKDMEFLNQKKWNRDEILACFKVPKLELGVWDDVNFAVAKVQAREFWVKTLVPKMKLIEWVMWAQLFSVSGTGNIYAEFDLSDVEALQGDMVEKVEMAFQLWQMGYPLNKLNKRFKLGLDDVPNGNASYVMQNVNQVDESGKITVAAAPMAPGGGEPPKPKKEPAAKKGDDYGEARLGD
jgi:HK97 family phage portal protein